MAFTGFLNINKPAGITSFAVVARVKELTRHPHVGHAGTLDPEATGVLPVAFGQATRLIEYLSESSKVYGAVFELGVTTDTGDASGQILTRKDPSGISPGLIEDALAGFRGTISQVPPMYSALRHHGERLYNLARAGVAIERQPRTVSIFRLEVVDFQSPLLTVEIECGKGTYIRALASDLGEKLGCGASMKNLIRRRVGPFALDGAIPLERLQELCLSGKWERCVHAPDFVLTGLPALVLGAAGEAAMRQGQKLPVVMENPPAPGEVRRVYTPDGRFIGLVKYDAPAGVWWPIRVFE